MPASNLKSSCKSKEAQMHKSGSRIPILSSITTKVNWFFHRSCRSHTANFTQIGPVALVQKWLQTDRQADLHDPKHNILLQHSSLEESNKNVKLSNTILKCSLFPEIDITVLILSACKVHR